MAKTMPMNPGTRREARQPTGRVRPGGGAGGRGLLSFLCPPPPTHPTGRSCFLRSARSDLGQAQTPNSSLFTDSG